jgi:hypothetical protein
VNFAVVLCFRSFFLLQQHVTIRSLSLFAACLYYCTLKIGPSSSEREIRYAYRTQSRLVHPDKHPEPGREKFTKLFQTVSCVFTTLASVLFWIYSIPSTIPSTVTPFPSRLETTSQRVFFLLSIRKGQLYQTPVSFILIIRHSTFSICKLQQQL